MTKDKKLYSKQEFEELESIFRLVINDYEKLHKFYALYKTYMQDGYPMPVPDCGTCDSSIAKYTERLHTWYLNNGSLFETK
jgi:hypothetical protein